jgi:flagellar protein FlaG
LTEKIISKRGKAMVNPVTMPAQAPIASTDNFKAQDIERRQEGLPRKAIEQKENITSAREEIPREEVEKATEKLNRLLGLFEKRMKFEIHEDSNRIMVKIIDKKTDEVLNEIPPEKILDMLSSFSDYVGLILDKKV